MMIPNINVGTLSDESLMILAKKIEIEKRERAIQRSIEREESINNAVNQHEEMIQRVSNYISPYVRQMCEEHFDNGGTGNARCGGIESYRFQQQQWKVEIRIHRDRQPGEKFSDD